MATMANGNETTFESVTCSRCGGSGKFSYCQMYGDRCFRCGGQGVTLTKRGAAAQIVYTDSLKIDAAAVAVGMKVLRPGVPGYIPSEWVSVDETNVDAIRAWAGRVRIAHTAAEKAEKKAAALAYQATLTKAGTARKRR